MKRAGVMGITAAIVAWVAYQSSTAPDLIQHVLKEKGGNPDWIKGLIGILVSFILVTGLAALLRHLRKKHS